MKKDLKLSIVIPAYNEEENFHRGVLEEVYKYLQKQNYLWEVLLVNDGSEDNTLNLFKKFVKDHPGFKVINIEHAGKVAAVSAGVNGAMGEYVLFTDFDQSTPIEEIGKVLEKFKEGVDFVIGQRNDEDMKWTLFKKLRSKVFNLLVQLIVLPGISDTQCGFKAFKNEIGKKLFNELIVTKYTQKGGYMGAFDVELLFLAKKHKYKISPVKIKWQYFDSNRLSKSEPLKMLRDVILVRSFDLQGGYSDKKSFFQKIFSSKHLFPIILLFMLTIPAVKDSIAIGYFPMHDDLQAMRQLVIDKCFKDGQIPCRWSVDLGYGYGYPLFNFYPPLPYYFGQLIHTLGFSFLDTVKVLAILNFFVSGIAMYILAQVFWGRWGALLSGLLYVYAPYHAVDVYVRAAMNEAWALALFPVIFWAIYKLITNPKWIYVALLALFTAFLMLSHNPMLMIFAPGALGWTIYWLIQTKNFKSIFKLSLAAIWALGLAAFFTLPVIFEQQYAHVETLVIGYFNYLAHFADLNQLFISTNWGFGDSRFGPVDDISFQIGHLHWMLSVLSLFVVFVLFKKDKKISLLVLLMLVMTTFYTFMTHQRSSFIWSAINSLQYLQFPWRFLTLSIFGTSFLGGSIILLFKNLPTLKKFRKILLVILLLSTVLLYKDYFKWKDHWPWVNDEYKFSGELWRLQITSGIFDYLPKWAPLPPAIPPRGDANFYDGKGQVEKIFKNSIKQEYKVTVEKSGIFQLETFYFPGWRYFVDGREVIIDPKEDKELGRPRIKLNPGEHIVTAKFTNTSIRTAGNSLSLVAWFLLLTYLAKFAIIDRVIHRFKR